MSEGNYFKVEKLFSKNVKYVDELFINLIKVVEVV